MNPRAKSNLLVEELPGETLVYDLDGHRAHCLNPTAAFLLRSADGERTPATLARMAEEAFGTPASEEVVHLGLERLARARLVEWKGAAQAPRGPSRRQAIRQMAALGLALPAVMTIVTPATAQATGLIPARCETMEDVGKCCRNRKTCIQLGGRFRCMGDPC